MHFIRYFECSIRAYWTFSSISHTGTDIFVTPYPTCMDGCTLKGKGDHFYSEWSHLLIVGFISVQFYSWVDWNNLSQVPCSRNRTRIFWITDWSYCYLYSYVYALLFDYLAENRQLIKKWVCKMVGDARRSRDHAPSLCCSRMLMVTRAAIFKGYAQFV